MFCLSEKERNKTVQPFSSSSLDDDDDGDEIIGASLEGICAFSQRETDDRGETDHHLLPNNNNNALSSSSLKRAFPNNVRLNRRLRRDKKEIDERTELFFVFVLVEIQVAEEDSLFVLLVQFWFFIEIGSNLLPLLINKHG